MPALWDPLSACRIVLVCRAQIVYSSSEVRQGLIQRYGDRCRQANLEVQRSVSRSWAASRSTGDACTLGMSGIVLICRLQVVYSSSERPSESHRLLR
jgi:hypothetical protein